jgi:hypothetical protein
MERQFRDMRESVFLQSEEIRILRAEKADTTAQYNELLTYVRQIFLLLSNSSPSAKRKIQEASDESPCKYARNRSLDLDDQEMLLLNQESIQTEPLQEPKNALQFLKPFAEVLKELKGLELSVCLKRAVKERWFQSEQIPVEAGSTGRNIKAKVLCVLRFTSEHVLSAEEKEEWMRKNNPKREDPNFAIWEANLGSFAMDVEKRLIQKLSDLKKTERYCREKRKENGQWNLQTY